MSAARQGNPFGERLGHPALETGKPPVSGFPAFHSPTTPSEPATPTCGEHSEPVGREIWIRDELLLSDLSPPAKLLIAYVAPWKLTSYDEITSVLPFGDDALADAIREARARGWLTISSGRTRKRPGEKFYPVNRYETVPRADPRSTVAPGYFKRLPVTPDLGASASLWILRAVYLREQARTGAIRLPHRVAAQLSGTTEDAVKSACSRWLRSGALVRVALPSAEKRVPTFVLTTGPYPHDLARFDPNHRSTVKLTNGTKVWASKKQAAFLQANEYRIPLSWASAHPQPILAERVIDQLMPRDIEHEMALVLGDNDIPA